MNRKTRLIPLGLSLIAIGCSGGDDSTKVESEHQFMAGMSAMYGNSEITGLSALELGYNYCRELDEGATLVSLYDRIDSLSDDERSMHGNVIDLAINTICILQ